MSRGGVTFLDGNVPQCQVEALLATHGECHTSCGAQSLDLHVALLYPVVVLCAWRTKWLQCALAQDGTQAQRQGLSTFLQCFPV